MPRSYGRRLDPRQRATGAAAPGPSGCSVSRAYASYASGLPSVNRAMANRFRSTNPVECIVIAPSTQHSQPCLTAQSRATGMRP